MKSYVTSLMLAGLLVSQVALLTQQERGCRVAITDPETGQELQAYNDSWAIIVGINKYRNVQQLDFAVADDACG